MNEKTDRRAPLAVRNSIGLAADQALNAAAEMRNPRQAAEHCALALEILRLECVADDLSPFALRAVLSGLLPQEARPRSRVH